METKKITAMKAETKSATPTKTKRKKREPRGWYITKGVKIPLDEFLKDDPPPTGPSRFDILKEKYPDFFELEILDMRAVLK